MKGQRGEMCGPVINSVGPTAWYSLLDLYTWPIILVIFFLPFRWLFLFLKPFVISNRLLQYNNLLNFIFYFTFVSMNNYTKFFFQKMFPKHFDPLFQLFLVFICEKKLIRISPEINYASRFNNIVKKLSKINGTTFILLWLLFHFYSLSFTNDSSLVDIITFISSNLR